jgi:tRNA(fMet)-specific endonuclease VapC
VKILDSDHCVALLRGRLDLRGRMRPLEELAVTAISVSELSYGAHKSARVAGNLAQLDVLLAGLTVLPFDDGAGREFGALRGRLEFAGQRLSDLDLQIAAIALQFAAPLLTHNRGHFARIPGLALEDWLE